MAALTGNSLSSLLQSSPRANKNMAALPSKPILLTNQIFSSLKEYHLSDGILYIKKVDQNFCSLLLLFGDWIYRNSGVQEILRWG